ncbi:hypothetical protein D0962_34655 [Leptolyngbyaceae cyanobacterium CCMR0082]|uniref:Uncharacterized protein n=1 Tax=Adonisia turfae CCMR0082 TaxID=2304604 RepID=A0A6M0SGX9_9CYAN|nr:hypothetical protein [Adonisia turfae]NEZ67840.1 hypothetical protein [Adonisia turfae CCMR0082]
MSLKPAFDRAYDHREHPEAIALRMLEFEETYWEHYGWPEACAIAIYNIARTGDYATAQSYAQWVYARLPKGADRMPSTKTLVEYAQGDFPYDEFNSLHVTLNLLDAGEFD